MAHTKRFGGRNIWKPSHWTGAGTNHRLGSDIGFDLSSQHALRPISTILYMKLERPLLIATFLLFVYETSAAPGAVPPALKLTDLPDPILEKIGKDADNLNSVTLFKHASNE